MKKYTFIIVLLIFACLTSFIAIDTIQSKRTEYQDKVLSPQPACSYVKTLKTVYNGGVVLPIPRWPNCVSAVKNIKEVWEIKNTSTTQLKFVFTLISSYNVNVTFIPSTVIINAGNTANITINYVFIKCPNPIPSTFLWSIKSYSGTNLNTLCDTQSYSKTNITCCCPCDVVVHQQPPTPYDCMSPGQEQTFVWYFKSPCNIIGADTVILNFGNISNCVSFVPSVLTISPGSPPQSVAIKVKMPTNAQPCQTKTFSFKVSINNCSAAGKRFDFLIPVCKCEVNNLYIYPQQPQEILNISCAGNNNIPKQRDLKIRLITQNSTCPVDNVFCEIIEPKPIGITIMNYTHGPFKVINSPAKEVIVQVKTNDFNCTTGIKTINVRFYWQCGGVGKSKTIQWRVNVVP